MSGTRPYRIVWHVVTCPICAGTIRLSGTDYNTRQIKTCGRPQCTEALRKRNRQPSSHLALPQHKEARRNAFYSSPNSGPVATNTSARDWHLLGPDGTVYHFRNLALWLRANAELFEAEDVELIPQSRRTGASTCRAQWQIGKLRPERERRKSSWKGWRWFVGEQA